jgi:hypothetical protein
MTNFLQLTTTLRKSYRQPQGTLQLKCQDHMFVACSGIQNASEQFVLCIQLPFVNFSLNPTPQKKYNGFKCQIQTNQNQTLACMKFLSHNGQYYFLQKYRPFPLNHPVSSKVQLLDLTHMEE